MSKVIVNLPKADQFIFDSNDDMATKRSSEGGFVLALSTPDMGNIQFTSKGEMHAAVPYNNPFFGTVISLDEGIDVEEMVAPFTIAFEKYLKMDPETLVSVLDEPIDTAMEEIPDFFNLTFKELFDVLVNEGGSEADVLALQTSDSGVFSSEMTLAQLMGQDVYEDDGIYVVHEGVNSDRNALSTVGSESDDGGGVTSGEITPTNNSSTPTSTPTGGGGGVVAPTVFGGGQVFEGGLLNGSGNGSPVVIGVLPDPPKVGDPVTAVSISAGYESFFDDAGYILQPFRPADDPYMGPNPGGYQITAQEALLMNNVVGDSALLLARDALEGDPAWKIVDDFGNVFLVNYYTGHYVYQLNSAFDQNALGDQIFFDYTITDPSFRTYGGQIYFDVVDDSPSPQAVKNLIQPDGDGGFVEVGYFVYDEVSLSQPIPGDYVQTYDSDTEQFIDFRVDNYLIQLLSPEGEERVAENNALYELLDTFIEIPSTLSVEDTLTLYWDGDGELPNGAYLNDVLLALKGDYTVNDFFDAIINAGDTIPDGPYDEIFYLVTGDPIFIYMFDTFGTNPQLINIDAIWGADGRPDNIITNLVITDMRSAVVNAFGFVESIGETPLTLPAQSVSFGSITAEMIANYENFQSNEHGIIDISVFGELDDVDKGVGNSALILSDYANVVRVDENGKLVSMLSENQIVVDQETGRYLVNLSHGYDNNGAATILGYTFTIGDVDGGGVTSTFGLVFVDQDNPNLDLIAPQSDFPGGFMSDDGISGNIFPYGIDFGLDGFGSIQVVTTADYFQHNGEVPNNVGFFYEWGNTTGSGVLVGEFGSLTFFANDPNHQFGDIEYALNPGAISTNDEFLVRIHDGDGTSSDWQSISFNSKAYVDATVLNFGSSVLDLISPALSGLALTDVIGEQTNLTLQNTYSNLDVGWVDAPASLSAASGQAILIFDPVDIISAREMIEFGGINGNIDFLQNRDLNGDGVFDSADDDFFEFDPDYYSMFKLWFDINGDAIIDDGETLSLADLGVVIDLDSFTAGTGTSSGNYLFGSGSITANEGAGAITGSFSQVGLAIKEPIQVIEPVFLDLNGDGHVALISAADSHVTIGMLDGSDNGNTIGWMGEGSGMLVYDPNNINNVVSLDQIRFTSYLEGAKTDLEGLKAFDSNHDNILDSHDAAFGDFKVWEDSNLNGIVDDHEMLNLSDHAIASISLVSDNDAHWNEGNIVHGVSSYETTDGESHVVADVSLAILPEGEGAPIESEAVITNPDALDLSQLDSTVYAGSGTASSTTLTVSDSSAEPVSTAEPTAPSSGEQVAVSQEQLQTIQSQS